MAHEKESNSAAALCNLPCRGIFLHDADRCAEGFKGEFKSKQWGPPRRKESVKVKNWQGRKGVWLRKDLSECVSSIGAGKYLSTERSGLPDPCSESAPVLSPTQRHV